MKTKKSLIIYGLLGGVIVICSWFVSNALLVSDSGQMDFELGELLGYVSMILALSTVFFGVKAYRDKAKGGKISFKDAFLNGLIIVLVASIIYVVGWMIYYPNFMPDFVDQYAAYQVTVYQEEGLSEAEIQGKIKEMDEWMEMYENPLIMAAFTFLEIFPVGLIIALLSALILKSKGS
ncbi:MAG: DUF4199 domain-containing protein [Cyclobacteriaceae bacterium]|nr:DUF4199 domain-containing protein [Cyclobacteriaceae bacterium HetDA_MAG_MS6]